MNGGHSLLEETPKRMIYCDYLYRQLCASKAQSRDTNVYQTEMEKQEVIFTGVGYYYPNVKEKVAAKVLFSC